MYIQGYYLITARKKLSPNFLLRQIYFSNLRVFVTYQIKLITNKNFKV